MTTVKLVDLISRDNKDHKKFLDGISFVMETKSPAISYLTYKEDSVKKLKGLCQRKWEDIVRFSAYKTIEDCPLKIIFNEEEDEIKDRTFSEIKNMLKDYPVSGEEREKIAMYGEYYKNFRKNIKNSKIRIGYVPEAKMIFDSFQGAMQDPENDVDHNRVSKVNAFLEILYLNFN